ncbi:hypothetical protein [Hymenobacter algoricola]|uniref:DUF4138 domain-containing protein n=1 Tax=Hymenobacter algoricola TaxID=486267 RepID=A0ABP7NMB8_9BACT
MHYRLLAGLLLAAAPAAHAQLNLEAISQDILHEGLALYQSERASWVSTDLLQASGQPLSQVSGYISYTTGDSVRTLFVGGPAGAPRVVADYRYPHNSIRAAFVRRTGPRALQPREQHLLTIRQQSLADLQQVPGAELPADAAFNAVILPKGSQFWVYILTAPIRPGVVLLGNDYLLRYDAAGKLLTSQKLHHRLIALGPAPAGQVVDASVHTHLPDLSPFITPTDICTLLLYHDRVPGQRHLVLGKKYVSIFSLPDARLAIITRRAFDKLRAAKRAAPQ